MTDREIHHINKNSKHHDKCKFPLKLIRFLTVSNLFTFEVVQKCQCCQLCVLRENLITLNCLRIYLEEMSSSLNIKRNFTIQLTLNLKSSRKPGFSVVNTRRNPTITTVEVTLKGKPVLAATFSIHELQHLLQQN